MTGMRMWIATALSLLAGLGGSLPAWARQGDPKVARTLWQVCQGAHVSKKVRLALFEAAVVESGVRNLRYGDADSIGVLQLRTSLWGYRRASSPALSARWFIARAQPIRHRYRSAGSLAQAVQRSGYPYRYGQAKWKAKRWIRYCRGWFQRRQGTPAPAGAR